MTSGSFCMKNWLKLWLLYDKYSCTQWSLSLRVLCFLLTRTWCCCHEPRKTQTRTDCCFCIQLLDQLISVHGWWHNTCKLPTPSQPPANCTNWEKFVFVFLTTCSQSCLCGPHRDTRTYQVCLFYMLIHLSFSVTIIRLKQRVQVDHPCQLIRAGFPKAGNAPCAVGATFLVHKSRLTWDRSCLQLERPS